MKHQWVRALVSGVLAVSLLSGCTPAVEDSYPSEAEEQKIVTLRWGITGEWDAEGQQPLQVDSKRMEKVNALLAQKGYPYRLEWEYIQKSWGTDELKVASEYSPQLDIVTFYANGYGAEQLEESLLPLEEYMEAGQPLAAVYQRFSPKVWEYDQVDGHTYNLGKLNDVIYPTYTVTMKGVKPDFDMAALQSGGNEAVPQSVQELGAAIKTAEPYVENWGDELAIECQFHLIAPGVGLDLSEGTEFENVWESGWMAEQADREIRWIEEKVGYTYYESSIDWEPIFQRRVGNQKDICTQEISLSNGEVIRTQIYAKPYTSQCKVKIQYISMTYAA